MEKKEQMYALIREWEQSGLTRDQFCNDHNIRVSTFGYWRTKYLRGENPETDSDFLPVYPAEINQVEIQYPSGVILRLPAGICVSQIRSLINI